MKPTRKPKRGWFMWVAVGLLVTHVAGMMTAVYIAVGDRTFVALPDYYAKSVRWDQSQELARRSDALGWTRSISLKPVSPGKFAVSVSLLDKAGTPVTGLKVKATAYPELFPNQAQYLILAEDVASYTTQYIHPAHGPVVIELTATRGDDTFVTRAVLMTGAPR